MDDVLDFPFAFNQFTRSFYDHGSVKFTRMLFLNHVNEIYSEQSVGLFPTPAIFDHYDLIKQAYATGQ